MLYAVRVSRFGVVLGSYRLCSERYYDRSNQESMQNLWAKTEAESPCFTSLVGMEGKDGRRPHVSTWPNPLRIEVTRSGHFYPLFKEASQRCFRCLRVYRVLLQREGVSEARCGMLGLGWHPVGSMLRPHTGDGAPFAAYPKCPCRALSRA
jgi:hypothetical protein